MEEVIKDNFKKVFVPSWFTVDLKSGVSFLLCCTARLFKHDSRRGKLICQVVAKKVLLRLIDFIRQ